MIAYLLGGVGLFILGMSLLTEGLRSLAGDALRRALTRFTGGSIRGFLAGLGVTALVQSSSATTVMTIGFVSAGLIAFSSAIAVIIGANLGTTSTGWLVSLVGLKFDVSLAALPFVGIGAAVRMLGRGRVVALGTALAGFGLIFVGIDTLQVGMGGLADRISLDGIDGGSILGILALVGIGAAMTVVMQSSSAAVATTLTALSAGAIGVPEAAALVIGQNIGTTVTATFAAIGASVPAKRTAVAHILFNLGTGVIALVALPTLESISEGVRRLIPGDPAAVSVAAFHTAFNLVGVLVFLPLTIPFSKFVERLLPDRKSPIAYRLDKSVAQVGAVGIEAVRRTLEDVSMILGKAGATAMSVEHGRAAARDAANQALPALDEARRFMEVIAINPQDPSEYRRHVSNLHALDHLTELERLMRVFPQVPSDFDGQSRARLRHVFESLSEWHERDPATARGQLEEYVNLLQPALQTIRHSALAKVAAGQSTQEATLVTLDFIRWADQAAWHAWRVSHHLWVAGGEHAIEAPVVL